MRQLETSLGKTLIGLDEASTAAPRSQGFADAD